MTTRILSFGAAVCFAAAAPLGAQKVAADTFSLRVFRGTGMKADTAAIPIQMLWVVADTAWVTLRQDSTTSFTYRFQRGDDGTWFKRDTVVKNVRVR